MRGLLWEAVNKLTFYAFFNIITSTSAFKDFSENKDRRYTKVKATAEIKGSMLIKSIMVRLNYVYHSVLQDGRRFFLSKFRQRFVCGL